MNEEEEEEEEEMNAEDMVNSIINEWAAREVQKHMRTIRRRR